jgi:hypothetical protein
MVSKQALGGTGRPVTDYWTDSVRRQALLPSAWAMTVPSPSRAHARQAAVQVPGPAENIQILLTQLLGNAGRVTPPERWLAAAGEYAGVAFRHPVEERTWVVAARGRVAIDPPGTRVGSVEPAVTVLADADRRIERLVLRLIAADPGEAALVADVRRSSAHRCGRLIAAMRGSRSRFCKTPGGPSVGGRSSGRTRDNRLSSLWRPTLLLIAGSARGVTRGSGRSRRLIVDRVRAGHRPGEVAKQLAVSR